MQNLLDRIKSMYDEYGVDVTPKLAYITEDCREAADQGPSGNLSGHYGIYLGDFVLSNILVSEEVPDEEVERSFDANFIHPEEYDEDVPLVVNNPLLLSDTGDFIWGIESYWSDEGLAHVMSAYKDSAKTVLERFSQNYAIGKFRIALDRQYEKNLRPDIDSD